MNRLRSAGFLSLSLACFGTGLLSGALQAADIAPASTQKTGLKGKDRVAEPQLAKASDDSEKARQRFKLQPGFTTKLWAAEPLLGNPVAFSVDDQGAMYVAETYRYRSSVLDIRHYFFMLEDDLACRTTDDRIAEIKKNFPNEWQKLAIETEVVRRVEDKAGAGKADTSTAYAEQMNTLLDGINSGVLAHDGEVWCTNIPNLWHLSGLKDGKAEKRESLSFGYGVRFSFTGHDMHGLAVGPDGRLYFSFGDRGAHVKTKEGKTLAFSDEGAVFRCELDGSHLEAFYRGLRNPQELAFDNHGNLFTGDNDSDMGDRERCVYLVEGGDSGWRVGWQHPPLGKDRDMWLVEKMWEPRKEKTPAYVLSPIMNLMDGPSGLAHNPGTGLPAKYDDAFLLCSFKGSAARSEITWWTVQENGAGFSPKQMPTTFIGNVQATDVDFGPDSRVYFTEWGEGWEGTGKGRIFQVENAEAAKAQETQMADVKKVLHEGFKQRSSAELGKLLAHADQRVRQRAQWALATKPDGAATLAAIAKSGAEGSAKALSRLHGIWGLGHIARLAGYQAPAAQASTLAPLLPLLSDPDAEVRAQAARVLGDGQVATALAPLTKALQDPNGRVKFFAAMGVGKLGQADSAKAIVEMLRANADKDEFLRHAGVVALVTLKNEGAIAAAAKDSSASVRLAALLVLRRQGQPAVAQFLSDSNPLLVIEAARAICDEGIAAAYPALAKLIAKPGTDEHLVLRILNANFRAGTPETAQGLAAFTAEETNAEALRVEGLKQLGLWATPPARDRVAGVFRPLPARPPEPATAALAAVLPKLLAGKSEGVGLAAIEAVNTLEMKGASPALLALVGQAKVSAKVRGKALETLAAFNDPKLSDAINQAFADPDPALRIEAMAMLGKLDPEAAAKQLSGVFAKAAVAEKKLILTALGDLKGAGADTVLAGLLKELAAGQLAPEAQLELIEAAGKRTALKKDLATWTDAAAAKDKLGRYAFALAGGDKVNGEKLFKENAIAQCFRCHRIQGVGGDVGPDLTKIGSQKDRRYLLESIVDPNANIAHGFESVMCTLTNGDIKAGIIKAETPVLLTLQTPGAGTPPDAIKKADIKLREMAPSGMPPGLGEMLSKRELRDILEYIASLK